MLTVIINKEEIKEKFTLKVIFDVFLMFIY